MSRDLIIFDCDGVLVDSEPIADKIFHNTLKAEGIHIPKELHVELFTGFALSDCLKKVEEYSGKKPCPGFASNYYDSLFTELRKSLKSIPGIENAIKQIPNKKCVASSGSHKKMSLTLGITGLLPLFENRIFSATEVKRGKPYPDLFLYAAKQCGARPENTVVIEDSLPGVKAGVAAKMQVFAYIKAKPSLAKTCLEAGATKTFLSMTELPALL